jgi:hypothetical protein
LVAFLFLNAFLVFCVLGSIALFCFHSKVRLVLSASFLIFNGLLFQLENEHEHHGNKVLFGFASISGLYFGEWLMDSIKRSRFDFESAHISSGNLRVCCSLLFMSIGPFVTSLGFVGGVDNRVLDFHLILLFMLIFSGVSFGLESFLLACPRNKQSFEGNL